jgi:hypothetical protein
MNCRWPSLNRCPSLLNPEPSWRGIHTSIRGNAFELGRLRGTGATQPPKTARTRGKCLTFFQSGDFCGLSYAVALPCSRLALLAGDREHHDAALAAQPG